MLFRSVVPGKVADAMAVSASLLLVPPCHSLASVASGEAVPLSSLPPPGVASVAASQLVTGEALPPHSDIGEALPPHSDIGEALPPHSDIEEAVPLFDIRGEAIAPRVELNLLQGASRTTGGVIHGQAMGGVPNHADFRMLNQLLVESNTKGTVHVYLSSTSTRGDISMMKPEMTITVPVNETIGPILRKLGGSYSPVQKENQHLYVYNEDGNWSVKGRFENALAEDDMADWIYDGKKYILRVFAEDNAHISSTPHVNAKSESSGSLEILGTSPSAGSYAYNAAQLNFISQLNIGKQYLDCDNHALRYAYSKYKEFCCVKKIWNARKSSNTWTGGGKIADLMGIFASSSYFYSHYEMFEMANKYSDMVKWLNDEDDCPSDDEEVWGFTIHAYNFDVLRRFLIAQGETVKDAKKKKNKEVLKNEVSEESKSKGKEKAKESKEKAKKKEKTGESSSKRIRKQK